MGRPRRMARSFAPAVMALGLSLSGVAVTGCGTQSRSFSEADRAAVQKVLMDQRDAWNGGDLDGFMAGYLQSPELVFTSGAKIRRGFKVTRDRFHERYGKDPSGLGTLAFQIEDVRGLGADGAVVLGHWKLTETPAAGDGVFSVIFERTPDGWKIVHDHTSATQEPKAPAAGAAGSGGAPANGDDQPAAE